MKFLEILTIAKNSLASDIHLSIGVPPIMRINGKLEKVNDDILSIADLEAFVDEILTKEQKTKLADEKSQGAVDIAYSISNVGRFRVNVYLQRGTYAVAIRVVALVIPSMEELGLPSIIKELSKLKRGLILVTGPTGSGKSTTLATMIDHMNKNRHEHIITIEDPIEFLHKHENCIINQREIGYDTFSFSEALRSALRQDPDIILVGEMRDLDTIATAITAAETGHLVLSTVHTVGAASTIDRIVDVFPPYQQQQIKVQLSSVLKGVISQQIMPTSNGGSRVAAFEIMTSTTAMQNLIREGKTHQLQTVIQTSSNLGMISMDDSLIDLYKRKKIKKEVLLRYSVDRKAVEREINSYY
ncbi:type IV pilus twitching motility protein PilT [Clostridiaceae bacterium HSG29]|nr:type IV pilus twitching motility protein PilT [Clostridiaceae bacterium HSG29]